MQIIRTILWVLLLAGLLLFAIVNWDPTVTVRIWQGLVVDTKIPAIVIVSFAIGFVPMWLIYRASKWQLKRKIASLENAARTAAATPLAREYPAKQDAPEPEPEPKPEPDPTLAPDDSDNTAPTPRGTLG